MKSRHLILPAEILTRELDARILQAQLAVARGWKVVVGSKAQINRSIWRFPRGVYLCQTLTSKRVTMLGYLKRLGFRNVGWCEEGLVYPGSEVYLKRRVATQTLELIDGLVAWGENSRKDLNVKAEPVGLQALALGNPRLDLLRPKFHQLYRAEADRLRRDHGDFILFNSNFASANPAPQVLVRGAGQGAAARRADPALALHYDKYLQYRRDLFAAFQQVVPVLAKHFTNNKIVVRPHPAENMDAWRQIAEPYDNVEIIREGAVMPWLLTARAIFHNGCTTAVEGALMGKAPIAYRPILEPELENLLANDVSKKTATQTELISTIEDSLAQRLALGAEEENQLNRFVANRKGELAATHIQDLFDEIYERAPAGQVSRLTSTATRGLTLARYVYKALRIGHKTDKYVPTVFPRTNIEYVRQRSDAIAACLEGQEPVQIREISKNIFEFSAPET